MSYTYPLKLHFRFLALAPRISVRDATGKEIFFVEQKVFALKEAIKVFDNSTDKHLLYTIKANQILDFGAKYLFHTDDEKHNIGAIQQDGMRSLYQASYTVLTKKEEPIYKIMQTNPMIALLDSILSMIPFAEFITGFVLNPSYILSHKEGEKAVMTMKKKPSFLESEFEITLAEEKLTKEEEIISLLSLIMIVQLERNRG